MMPRSALDRRAGAAALVLVAAVVLRGWFFLEYDESYFDSDQAIVGLMAKHLVEGRAWPLFFYGQEYMLAVEAWLMAPVFAVMGPTIFALRLTMVLLNAVTTLALWRLLVRFAGLGVWSAALASAPFALAPFVTSAHLVEAQGGNIEPFLWVLVAWLLRRRPLALGAMMAVAFAHREFTAYALSALLLVQVAEHRRQLLSLVRPWLLTTCAFVACLQGINALKPHADLLGPGSAGIPAVDGSPAHGTVALLLAHANVDWARLPGRFRVLTTEYLPMVVGLDGYRPYLISIASDVHVGWREFLPLVAGVWALLWAWLVVDLVRRRDVEGVGLPVYLGLVGLQAAMVYALTRDLSMFTFRYGLLALFLPVACFALLLQPGRPPGLRAAGAALCGFLAAASLVDHLTVLQRAGVAPPEARLRPLADHLAARGIHVARARYWHAYALTFMTAERVIVASLDLERIREYQILADQAGAGVVTIQREPCADQPQDEPVAGWHLCR